MPLTDPLLRLCGTHANVFDTATFDALLAVRHPASARDDRGWTVLMHAVRRCSEAQVLAILDLPDVNPKAQAFDGSTALMTAVQAGRADLLPVLLPVSDPHQRQADAPNGWTALDFAAMWDQNACVSGLLPLATPDELLNTIGLCVANRRPAMLCTLIEVLPETALDAAQTTLVEVSPLASAIRSTGEEALLRRHQVVLAQHLREAAGPATDPTTGPARRPRL